MGSGGGGIFELADEERCILLTKQSAKHRDHIILVNIVTLYRSSINILFNLYHKLKMPS